MIKEYVRTLSDETLVQCVRDYDAYEETGSLGERTELRFRVTECIADNKAAQATFVLWVERFMFEVFHHFAILYLEK
jgi:hypothetical protein